MKKIEHLLFSLFLLLLPTQLGKHFWPEFAYVQGIRVDYLSPTLFVTDLLICFLFVLWGVNTLNYINSKRKIRNSKQIKNTNDKNNKHFGFRLYVIFCLYLLFGILLSHNVFNGFYHLLKFLEFSFVAYYVASTIRSRHQFLWIITLLSISSIAESLLVMWQSINQGSIGGIFYLFGERFFTGSTPGIANAAINGQLILRPYGTFPHPNVLAGFLFFVMTLNLFGIRLIKRHWHQYLFFASLLLGTSALLLSMSRVILVLWFLLVVLLGVTLAKKKIVVVSLLILFSALLFTPLGTRLLQTRLTEEAVLQRESLIAASVTLLQTHPFVGVGLGNFLPALSVVQHPRSLFVYLQPVHTIFMLLLVEVGIIGFLVCLWFFWKTYRRLLHRYSAFPDERIVVCCRLVLLTSVLVLGCVDHYWLTLQQGQLLFAVLIGLCWVDNQPQY